MEKQLLEKAKEQLVLEKQKVSQKAHQEPVRSRTEKFIASCEIVDPVTAFILAFLVPRIDMEK